MARRGVLGMLVGGATALLSGCGLSGNPIYRFKMTVEVETPEGLKTGWSVYEVEAKNVVALTPGGVGRERKLRGQAVAVDIALGKVLFVLVKNDSLAEMSMAALDPAYKNDWVESAERIAAGAGIHSPAVIMTSNYPMLVTFADLSDPKTVDQVSPDNLASRFGAGVTLKRITVQVTDEPVTAGIEKRLSWLPQYYDKQLSGDRYQSIENNHKGISAFIGAGVFSAGMGLSPYEKGL
jgi:hypothetical protein